MVTGIEGNFTEDPEGRWIGAGWARLSDMMKARGIEPCGSGCWFEEHLEPVTPGMTWMDLHLEVE